MSSPPGRYSLGRGVAAALGSSLGGAAVLAALTPLLGAGAALKLVAALLGFAYVIYVVTQSGERTGRVAALAAWLIVAVAAWIAGLSVGAYVLVQVALVWVARALYFYSGVLPALFDLGLTALGAALAVWSATRTHSAAVAFWCFFLVQACHVLIPARLTGDEVPSDDNDRFDRAYRAAEAAVRRMSATR